MEPSLPPLANRQSLHSRVRWRGDGNGSHEKQLQPRWQGRSPGVTKGWTQCTAIKRFALGVCPNNLQIATIKFFFRHIYCGGNLPLSKPSGDDSV